MEFRIVDYTTDYMQDVYQLETQQWGIWGEEAYIKEVKSNQIVRVALCGDVIAGICYGTFENRSFHIEVCCIKPEYQKKGLGTRFLKEMIALAQEKFDAKIFRAEAISVYGHANAARVLEHNGFVFVKEEKLYWRREHPEVFCTECHKQPCECDALFYELRLK